MQAKQHASLIELARVLSDETKLRPINEERVEEIMLSFRSKGQQQPIKVRPKNGGGYYVIVVFGEHRTEAGKRLAARGEPIKGFPIGQIMAVVEQVGELEALELKFTENSHRNDFVDPWEEGKVFDRLLRDKYSNNINALSDSISKSGSYISERLQVFHFLEPSLRKYVGTALNIGNVVSLAKIPSPQPQLQLAEAIIRSRGVLIGEKGGGALTGRVLVHVTHACPLCGMVHDVKKGFPRATNKAAVEGGEIKGVDVIMGTNGRNQIIHIANPVRDGVSFDGIDLMETWKAKLPRDTDPKAVPYLCETCFSAWRRRR